MKQFGESFEATIHINQKLSNTEKFTYLKGYLKKAALRAIEAPPDEW